MLVASLRYVFFLALLVINVLFFLQADRNNDATPQLASGELVQCWGASVRRCRGDALRFAERKDDQSLLKFTRVAQKAGNKAYGFSIPVSVLDQHNR